MTRLISQTRDVQMLLWAVGEARDRGRDGERNRLDTLGDSEKSGEPNFFTEWQPAAHESRRANDIPGE